eukprot:179460-Chlamydomonas_euryale.AAC.2
MQWQGNGYDIVVAALGSTVAICGGACYAAAGKWLIHSRNVVPAHFRNNKSHVTLSTYVLST